MFRFLIFFALIVCALTHPLIRETREVGNEPTENTVKSDGEAGGTNLDSRFGGYGGYGGHGGHARPYGGYGHGME